MPDDCKVYGAMRYGNPSLVSTLQQIKNDGIQEVTVLPLFPQYASSTTGTVVAKIFKETAKWHTIPAIRIVDQFYDHPAFIKAFANRIKSFKPESFNHIIFSYHGLPERQITKIHPSVPCQNCNCSNEIPGHGTFCYKATCYATTRLLISHLNISSQKTTTTFQSRLSKNWLTPFTDETILALAHKDVKRILVVAPAFVADCLETIVEIEDYNLLFQKHGGQELVLVPSLNDEDDWVNGILEIISLGF
jgi:ferrochelatase